MIKFVLFGSGNIGMEFLHEIGNDRVKYFVDNDPQKKGKQYDGIFVYHFDDVCEALKNEVVIIATSSRFFPEIEKQLKTYKISYIGIEDAKVAITKEKIESRPDFVSIYQKAIHWIRKYTLDGQGIINNTGLKLAYPEVSGYFIPTLLHWGQRDLALQYTEWLLEVQNKDGSWNNTEGSTPYIFDTAQVLKGLISVRGISPSKRIDDAILKACDWIIGCIDIEGRLVTPSTSAWGDDKDFCDEVIHIYCLSPLIQAGSIFNNPYYEELARKSLKYYKDKYYDKIIRFSLLSHFYAYLMEALLDLGESQILYAAMKNLEGYQLESGAVPGLNNADWVCSTGLFQLAMVWYRLGDRERAERAFCYACKLQNASGGWYGSYISENGDGKEGSYFPREEISWCNKFFLDALYWRNKTFFNGEMEDFWSLLDKQDGRYRIVEKAVKWAITYKVKKPDKASILDIGCGKGRYLRNLLDYASELKLCAVDLSMKIDIDLVNAGIDFYEGSLLEIPFNDDEFDVVYTVETLEHAIDIEAAIAEMARVTKSGGKFIVIDKDVEALGKLEIGDCEQWFDKEIVRRMMLKYCEKVEVETDISYDGNSSDGLFCAWIGLVK